MGVFGRAIDRTCSQTLLEIQTADDIRWMYDQNLLVLFRQLYIDHIFLQGQFASWAW